MPHISRKVISGVLLLLAGAALFQIIRQSYIYRSTITTVDRISRTKAQINTTEAATDLIELIAVLKSTAENLAETLSSSTLSQSKIEELLKEKPAELHGLGIAFIPYGYDKSTQLYAPYYQERKGENVLTHIGEEYDYTDPEVSWFNHPLRQGAGFIDPYYGTSSKTVIAEYAVPFYDSQDTDPDRKPIGIVFSNQSVDHLTHIIASRYSGATGYWFLLSKNGTFLAHPEKQLTAKPTTIFDLAEKREDETLNQAGMDAIAGNEVFVNYNNEITNSPSMLICAPITNVDWSLCQVFDTNELPFKKDLLRKKLMHIIFSTVIFLFLMILFALSLLAYSDRSLWTISLCSAAVFALGIGALWTTSDWYPHYEIRDIEIEDKQSLRHFWHSIAARSPGIVNSKPQSAITPESTLSDAASSTHIPTGIFINDLQVKDPSQIAFTGYIWQRYHAKKHTGITRGFILPQALRTSIREIHRSKSGNDELITWEVSADISQRVDYFMYPFDIKGLEWEIWHPDFKEGVFLDPDLDAYKILNPRSLPGVSHDARLEGWDLTSSFFSYRFSYPRTNFGMYTRGAFGTYKQAETEGKPSLTFVVRAERRLVETLVADLLPIAVLALLLFTTLMAMNLLGIGALGACTSIAFGTIVAQARFRARVPAYELTYFENFFFMLYIALLFVVMLALIRQLEIGKKLSGPLEKALQLLYWPTILGVLMIITARYLY